MPDLGGAIEQKMGVKTTGPPVKKRKPGHNPGLVTHNALENRARRTHPYLNRNPVPGQSPVLGTWMKNFKLQNPNCINLVPSVIALLLIKKLESRPKPFKFL
jgi:hypothetical protein